MTSRRPRSKLRSRQRSLKRTDVVANAVRELSHEELPDLGRLRLVLRAHLREKLLARKGRFSGLRDKIRIKLREKLSRRGW